VESNESVVGDGCQRARLLSTKHDSTLDRAVAPTPSKYWFNVANHGGDVPSCFRRGIVGGPLDVGALDGSLAFLGS